MMNVSKKSRGTSKSEEETRGVPPLWVVGVVVALIIMGVALAGVKYPGILPIILAGSAGFVVIIPMVLYQQVRKALMDKLPPLVRDVLAQELQAQQQAVTDRLPTLVTTKIQGILQQISRDSVNEAVKDAVEKYQQTQEAQRCLEEHIREQQQQIKQDYERIKSMISQVLPETTLLDPMEKRTDELFRVLVQAITVQKQNVNTLHRGIANLCTEVREKFTFLRGVNWEGDPEGQLCQIRDQLGRVEAELGDRARQINQHAEQISEQAGLLKKLAGYIILEPHRPPVVELSRDDLRQVTDESLAALRDSRLRLQRIPLLDKTSQLAGVAALTLARCQSLYYQIEEQGDGLLPPQFPSLFEFDLCDRLKSDFCVAETLRLGNPNRIDPDHQADIEDGLRRLLADYYWKHCSQALVLNEYLQQFIVRVDESGQYRSLADQLQMLAGLLREIFSSVDIVPLEIHLFETGLDPQRHNFETPPQYLCQKAYREFVKTLVDEGKLRANMICEIQEWGYESPHLNPCKALVLQYHPESYEVLFSEC